jgi:hypothetical protein
VFALRLLLCVCCRVVAALVQGWSGFIQRGIYRQIKRSHKRSKWEYQPERLKRHAALALHATACNGSSDEETEGSSPPSREATSQDELTAPLLSRRGRIPSVPAGEVPTGSPFELIGAGLPAFCEDNSTGGSSSTSQSRTSFSCTSQTSGCVTDSSGDGPEQPEILARWSPVSWQDSPRTGGLRTTSSAVVMQLEGACAPLLQPHGSLPLNLEGVLHPHVAGRAAGSES